ncbi:MAG: hypothetical protein E6I84_07620 [Chloroflexi bacterium]|nr:MAG: hypothetical protein E6I84_07620 [Chloroflexota bacterium]
MRKRPLAGAVVGIAVLVLIGAAGYTAYAGGSVYHSLDSGRQELVAAQTTMKNAGRSADVSQLDAALAELKRAERDFDDAKARAQGDPALRLAGGVPAAGQQVDASAHLAAIGADLSRAGEAAAVVAIQVATLRNKYAGHPLTADDLQAILEQAQAIVKTYSGSIQAIGQELRAAHGERAQVTTTDLVPPMRNAYDAVDRALTDADTAFLRYQDVRQVLSDLLGVQLPA